MPDFRDNAALLLSAWQQHAGPCRLYAAQLCAWPDDVVQEAFVRLMRHLQTKPPPDHPRAWLLTAVRSAAFDLGKSETRRRQREQRVALFDQTASPGANAPFDTSDVEAALQEVPQTGREIVVLRLWNGLSFEQIAGLVGTSPSTAHTRYTAAIRQLRQIFGEDNG
ncbi:MAG: sigma-70 family RNA polymerase sigma factor [Planctomycetota bacterium]